ncbi:MAG: hypothetical protein HY323_13040 [Betaproteobacteria bacterium]|nr:hypothetical protein [Betaproteobacteria bacterium]
MAHFARESRGAFACANLRATESYREKRRGVRLAARFDLDHRRINAPEAG